MPRKIRINQNNVGIGKQVYHNGATVTIDDETYASLLAAGRFSSGVLTDEGDEPEDIIDSTGTIAYAENKTGVATSFTTSPVPCFGCVLVVPPCERDVWLEGQVWTAITTGGIGTINAVFYEITGGSAVLLGGGAIPSALATGSIISSGAIPVRYRLGPVSSIRTFQLYGFVYRPAGLLAAQFMNSNNETNKSHVTAVAR